MKTKPTIMTDKSIFYLYTSKMSLLYRGVNSETNELNINIDQVLFENDFKIEKGTINPREYKTLVPNSSPS